MPKDTTNEEQVPSGAWQQEPCAPSSARIRKSHRRRGRQRRLDGGKGDERHSQRSSSCAHEICLSRSYQMRPGPRDRAPARVPPGNQVHTALRRGCPEGAITGAQHYTPTLPPGTPPTQGHNPPCCPPFARRTLHRGSRLFSPSPHEAQLYSATGLLLSYQQYSQLDWEGDRWPCAAAAAKAGACREETP